MDKKIETFGNYILLKKIASGGMAEVFLARPAVREADGRLLVIKRILPHIATQPEFTNMFQREIQTIMGFNHANVVQLHDFGSAGGQPYIAMEYIEGKSLREINAKLKSKNVKMPVPVALSIVAQAASGLHYAHTFTHKINGKPHHTIHRDVSPHNLIVSYEGNLKVIDFGISTAGGVAHELTDAGTVKGKVGYFSPEQLLGKNIDARTDIFSLGIVAWELLTGERLFVRPGETDVNIMAKISQCEKYVSRPSSYNRDVMPEIDSLIMKALDKDPAKRFREAREFQGEIRRLLRGHYPAYKYDDTGQLVSILFAEEMTNERLQTNELNNRAQKMLAASVDDKTTAIDSDTNTLTSKLNKRVEGVASRLSKIEGEMKQEASGRHYLMLVFYVASLIVLKFGDRYNYWIDFSIQKAKASETAVIHVVSPKATTLVPPAMPTQRIPATVASSQTAPVYVQSAQARSQVRPLAQALTARTVLPSNVQNPARRKQPRQQQ